MTEALPLAAAVVTVSALVVFTARRIVLAAAAFAPARRADESGAGPPTVTVVVPARNESERIEDLLRSLERLEYPGDRLRFAIVDDFSEDDTADRIRRWAADRGDATAVILLAHSGRAGALNAGIEAVPRSEVVAVCDADLRPEPDWLARLVGFLSDPATGAVAAYLRPRNAKASLVSRYAALETWTHQLVTSAGKDRLGLNPPALGACAYRRAAIDSIGGFRRGSSPGDDVHASAALTRMGWTTRFCEAAVALNTVVEDSLDYWHQHVRWGRNVLAADGRNPAAIPKARARRTLPRAIESALARSGYADRLVFAGAATLALAGQLSPWFPVAYLAITAGESAAAVVRAGQWRWLPSYGLAAIAMFVLDLAASAAALTAQLTRRPRRWRAISRLDRGPERVAEAHQARAR